MTYEECLFWLNFNSRAHVERDIYNLMLNYAETDFNSRAHVERDYRRRS